MHSLGVVYSHVNHIVLNSPRVVNWSLGSVAAQGSLLWSSLAILRWASLFLRSLARLLIYGLFSCSVHNRDNNFSSPGELSSSYYDPTFPHLLPPSHRNTDDGSLPFFLSSSPVQSMNERFWTFSFDASILLVFYTIVVAGSSCSTEFCPLHFFFFFRGWFSTNTDCRVTTTSFLGFHHPAEQPQDRKRSTTTMFWSSGHQLKMMGQVIFWPTTDSMKKSRERSTYYQRWLAFNLFNFDDITAFVLY